MCLPKDQCPACAPTLPNELRRCELDLLPTASFASPRSVVWVRFRTGSHRIPCVQTRRGCLDCGNVDSRILLYCQSLVEDVESESEFQSSERATKFRETRARGVRNLNFRH